MCRSLGGLITFDSVLPRPANAAVSRAKRIRSTAKGSASPPPGAGIPGRVESRTRHDLDDGVTQVPELITSLRWGEIYGLLEAATDNGENIGHTLEGILIKYA